VIKHVVRMGAFAIIFLGSKFFDDLTADFPPSAMRRYLETAIATAFFGLLMALADRFLEKRQ
jgi:hypothetical protein